MNFYQSIAPYYHHIFKINQDQVHFVQQKIIDKSSYLLDVGCGIGTLSFELSHYYTQITGIDLDAEMIQYALNQQDRKLNSLQFHQLSMLALNQKFDKNSFDGIICFGNTLVHLNSLDQVMDFLKQAKSILKSDGKLLIQLVNYDRILSKQIKELPLIENDEILFERKYHYNTETNSIDFNTLLTVKSTHQQIKNSVVLLPILKSALEQLLKKAGFQNSNFFGNFKGEMYDLDSPALIVEAW
ncbi:MAG TPA: class I SAM-dependent methyltransferase [Flavobacteriaceae bacterium]|nr:class I SAM-dependent methyltransferase [Flavobacteriaceae bacterium]